MKSSAQIAMALWAIVAVCQPAAAPAEDYIQFFGGDQPATNAGVENLAGQGQPLCPSGDPAPGGGQPCGAFWSKLSCDECPPYGIVGLVGLDAFKGVSDGQFEDNFGTVLSLSAGMPVYGLRDYGIGWQIGTSYDAYDYDGIGWAQFDREGVQQQIFFTTGFFRKAHDDQRLSLGVVHDWMLNSYWGMFGTNPTFSQWRGQIEYALGGCNSLGAWGCLRDNVSTQIGEFYSLVTARAEDQVNLFWHHKFCSTGADSYLWAGIPERGRLGPEAGSSLGDMTIGITVQSPLSEKLILYANGSYFRPSDSAGAVAAADNGYDVCVGLMWYFGGNSLSPSINGNCWTPYMPMANNSNFLVDQSAVSPYGYYSVP